MKQGKAILVLTAVAGVLNWQGVPASAQDVPDTKNVPAESNRDNSVQTPMDASGYMRRRIQGGTVLRKVDNDRMTREQRDKIRQFVDEEVKQLQALGRDKSLARQQKMEKARQIRAAKQEKIKEILTPEQLKKYEETREKDRAFREKLRAGKTKATHLTQVPKGPEL